MSYLFYSWGAPTIAPILLVMTVLDYALGGFISPKATASPGKKKLLLSLGIAANLSLLLYFKYWNFFLGELSTLFTSLGFTGVHWQAVLLPIGISFFTFQKISYLIDVYRGTAKPAQTLIHYALYVALFPQLIAGPIVRYHEIADQLHERRSSREDFCAGLTRFSLGLSKKVLIADFLGQVADKIFALGGGELTTSFAWVGILAYTFQIYFDFSGYSDMAIGIGRIFGFTFPENFNQPYLARNFREFWSRWHMTLSNWMKEYLYIPLGGNRSSEFRTAGNLWAVFLLSGLWHGASWNFIVWGAYHGFFLSLERLLGVSSFKNTSLARILVVFPLIIFSWVLFRADDLSHALFYFSHLFGFSGEALSKPIVWGELIQSREWWVLGMAFLISFAPLGWRINLSAPKVSAPLAATSYALLLFSLAALAGIDYTPFLYFRF